MSADAGARGLGTWLAAALAAVAVATVIAALSVTGGPAAQREARLDERRVPDLREIAQAIDRHQQTHGVLPTSLAALNDQPGVELAVADPETGAAYGYEPANGQRYRLCATFHTDSAARRNTEWAHASASHCFERTANADRPPR